MMKKNKWKLIISSVVILLPIFIGLCLPGFTFNGNNSITGSKMFLVFGIPLFLLAMHWVGIFLTVHDPNNIDQSQKVLNMVIWLIPVISLIVEGISYSLALGSTINVNIMVRIFFGVLFVVLGNYMPKCKQNYTIGVRVTWALRNEENWNKTHRFTGRLWVFGGLFILATMLIKKEEFMYVLMLAILVMAFTPMIYSYLYYRKQLKIGTASKEDSMKAPGDGNTTKMAWIIGCIIVVAAIIFLFTGSYDVKFDDSSFTIDASYWDDMTVNYADIENIEYRNEPVSGSRTFGYGSMSLIMGECENEEFGKYTNYTYSSCDACIVLTIDGKKLVINGKDNESTKEMYNQLITRTNLQNEPSVVQTYDVTDSEHAFENDQLVTLVKYYEMSDGTWKTDNYTYQYRLEITGRMNGAAKDSTYVFLSNIKDITFEQAWKASGLSSSMEDYFQEEDAKLVGMK